VYTRKLRPTYLLLLDMGIIPGSAVLEELVRNEPDILKGRHTFVRALAPGQWHLLGPIREVLINVIPTHPDLLNEWSVLQQHDKFFSDMSFLEELAVRLPTPWLKMRSSWVDRYLASTKACEPEKYPEIFESLKPIRWNSTLVDVWGKDRLSKWMEDKSSVSVSSIKLYSHSSYTALYWSELERCQDRNTTAFLPLFEQMLPKQYHPLLAHASHTTFEDRELRLLTDHDVVCRARITRKRRRSNCCSRKCHTSGLRFHMWLSKQTAALKSAGRRGYQEHDLGLYDNSLLADWEDPKFDRQRFLSECETTGFPIQHLMATMAGRSYMQDQLEALKIKPNLNSLSAAIRANDPVATHFHDEVIRKADLGKLLLVCFERNSMQAFNALAEYATSDQAERVGELRGLMIDK
jgi:hypothetical protein